MDPAVALILASLGKYIGFANGEFKTLDQVNKSYNQTAGQTGSLPKRYSSTARLGRPQEMPRTKTMAAKAMGVAPEGR